jgi:hypothetical protein
MRSRVILEFQRDESEIRDLREANLREVTPAVIEASYMNLPVRFTVDGVPIVRSSQSDESVWAAPVGGAPPTRGPVQKRTVPARTPLLHFAHALSSGLATAASSGSATVTVPEGGRIQLKVAGSLATVVGETGEQVEVDFDDLQIAVIQFRQALARLLDEEVPGMRDEPAFAAWFNLPRTDH